MGQIQKVNNNLAKVHQLGSMLEAMSSAKICDLPQIEVDTVLMTAVHRAYKDKGQTVMCDDMDYIVDNLCERVLSSCPYIRIAELPIAIEKGILGDYGDYFGLNVITFVSFIKKHYASSKRAELAKQSKSSEDENTIPPIEEQKRTQREVIIKSFESFKKYGVYTDYGNYIYRSLKQMNAFNFSEEKQKEFLSKSKKKVISSLQADMIQKPHERNKIKKILEDVELMQEEGKTMVYKEALQIALMSFFTDLVEMDQEVTDYLTEE